MLITAIIPTYNRAQLLARAVRSVLAQSHPGTRVLVADNASPDDTQTVMADLMRQDPRVAYHRHERNLGAVANFQWLLSNVQTEAFSILSDDDLLLPGFHARAARALTEHPGAGLYCSQTVKFTLADGTQRLRPRQGWQPGPHPAGEHTPRMLSEHFVWTACVFTRALRDELGPVDPAPMGDGLYLASAVAARPFVVDMRPGAIFCTGLTNTSSGLSLEQLRANVDASRRVTGAMPLTPALREQTLREALRLVAFTSAGNLARAIRDGDTPHARGAAQIMRELGQLTPSRALRAWLMQQGAPGRALARAWQQGFRGWKRAQRGGAGLTIAHLLAQHAPDAPPALLHWIEHGGPRPPTT
jgi:hypothetical protein